MKLLSTISYASAGLVTYILALVVEVSLKTAVALCTLKILLKVFGGL